jgi:hypothetical protein
MIKGLLDADFEVIISSDPDLGQKINKLFAERKGSSAFRKLAELIPGTEICIYVPEEFHSGLMPSGIHGFEVGSETEWKEPLLVESLVREYIDEVMVSLVGPSYMPEFY